MKWIIILCAGGVISYLIEGVLPNFENKKLENIFGIICVLCASILMLEFWFPPWRINTGYAQFKSVGHFPRLPPADDLVYDDGENYYYATGEDHTVDMDYSIDNKRLFIEATVIVAVPSVLIAFGVFKEKRKKLKK